MYVLYILYIHTTRIPRILRTTLCDLLYDFIYHFSSYSLMGSIMAYATSINSLSSALSSYNTYLIKSIILTFSSLSLSLKTFIISKLLIKSVVLLSLFASVYAK